VTEEEYRRLMRFVRGGAARSIAELVRLAVTEYTSKAGMMKLVNLRDIPMPEAKRVVERYLKKHPGTVWPDEMAEELGIDYRIVLAVVKELLAERKVEESSRKAEEIPA
jgi:predicted transcriptional regulator